MNSQTEPIITKAASVATYGGSGGAVYFGLTANELGVYVGIVVAIAGFIVNWYYKAQHLRLARELHRPAEEE